MAVPNDVCINLKPLGDLPKISLPLGAEFSSVIDFANGLPSDCSAALNLSGQISVALGNLKCLMTMLEVFQKLSELVSNPLTFPKKIGDLAAPLAKLAECFVSITPAAVVISIRDIIEAILKILSCLIEEIESIIHFRARLDVSAAVDNPKLADILSCAQQNADASAASVLQALGSFATILNTVASLPGASSLGIPQLPTSFQVSAATPSLSDITDTSALEGIVNVLRDIVDALQTVVDGIPG